MATMAGDDALVGIASTVVQLGALDDTVAAPATAAGSKPEVSGRDRYQQRGLLGEGGMGRVERVWDADLMREVAAKELRPELCENARLLQQFLWEARVTAFLDHPNIVPVHDLGVSPAGHLYFTMKLVRGQSLESALDELTRGDESATRNLSEQRRLRMFLQLCNAVAYAHSLGVLHRDLKPANVMLGPHGEVLVTDWGLAIPLPGPEGDSLREQVPENLARSGSGTPVYMSPEQAREEELDARSDVYALGAILFELVELRRAVEAETVAGILVKVSTGDVAAPAKATAPLAAVIRKAMALERAERYQSATELAEEVETVLDGRTPVAEGASVLTQATRYYFSHDPAMSRLRVVDIDLWVGSMFFLGAAAAVGFAKWITIDWWWLLLAGFALAIPSTRRWLLLRNAAKRRDSRA